MFGIDMAPPAQARVTPTDQALDGVHDPHAATPTEETRSGKSKNRAPKGEGQRLTVEKRQAIAARRHEYWAERRAQRRKRKAAKL